MKKLKVVREWDYDDKDGWALVNIVSAFIARTMAVLAIAFILVVLAGAAFLARVIWVLTS
jgi:hypothetical protein